MNPAPSAAAAPAPPPPRPVCFRNPRPWLALAPMQDVSTAAFMEIIARRGAPDWFVTEFFRVHETSTLSPEILECARVPAATGVPVFAQLIGENVPHLARAAAALMRHPFAGIDLNLGCPAPKVFRKNVGGGLLRDLPHASAILAALRAALPDAPLTVKARISFDDAARAATPPALHALLREHRADLFTLHARTVRGLYHTPVDYDAIADAVRALPGCPVAANGEISSAAKAAAVHARTGCAALMCGRHAVRNPWLFRQIREHLSGQPVFQPTLADVHAYIEELIAATAPTPTAPAAATADALSTDAENHRAAGGVPARVTSGEAAATNRPRALPASVRHASRMKKFLNFVGTGVDPQGVFLHEMRRAADMSALRRVCERHLLVPARRSLPFPAEPYPGLLARPNCESPA